MTNPTEKLYTVRQKVFITLAAGLYPLIHYYNGNFDIADSWYQFLFLVGICLILPLWLVFMIGLLMKWKPLGFLHKNYLAAINLVVFFGLLSLLIFHPGKKFFVLIIIGAFFLSFLLHKHLYKVAVLQYLLAIIALVTFVPRAFFMLNYSDDWAEVHDTIVEAEFKSKPNIYVIQPDGYTNFDEMRKPPYDNQNRGFERWLEKTGFVNYGNFRSNYYSTLTSNASMFAMKHHYYSNTYPGNLKTYASQDIIVGKNTTLEILKNNGYENYLLTDNSFFLVFRKLESYDYCNVPQSKILPYDTGGVKGIDIVSDFEKQLQLDKEKPQFYFIEKTTPSHIMYTTAASAGIEEEREAYFKRLKRAHGWLGDLIRLIEKYDDNALIVLVADHGGYVGLTSVKEVERRRLNEIETISVFSSLLSIKWPNNQVPQNLEFRSNVNLFRNLFSYLSDNEEYLLYEEEDGSYLPLYTGLNADFFRLLDDEGNFGYQKVE
ncbi:MAG: hypothetical protein HKN48_00515 [Flavobacteriaceae bacterium]|nr:hypothetical protein [Flavobacteriaceae bacterium]